MAYIDKIKIGSDTHTLALTPSKGSATVPVYFDANGLPQPCTSSFSNYLPLAGGTMGGTAQIIWPDSGNWSAGNSGITFPVKRGGLYWSGQSDWIDMFSEESSSDMLDLVIQFGDDSSSALKIRNTNGTNTITLAAGGNISTTGAIAANGNISGAKISAGSKVELWTDGEGGNIRLTSPNGSLWSIDALENTKLRFIWAESEVPFSFSKDGTISGAYFTGTANYANSAGTAADMPVTTITKSLTVTTSWQNTGIVSSNLPTGTYAVQISGISNGNCGLWGDIFSGVMSWHDGGTNGGDADEIMLHSAGHARNGGHLFLRIQRTANTDGKTYLQIRAASNASAAQNVVFKFRRLI